MWKQSRQVQLHVHVRGREGKHPKTYQAENIRASIHEDDEKIVAVMQRFFTVFHASQVEGIDEYTQQQVNEIEAHETAEKIISASNALKRNLTGERYSRTYAREELVAEIGSMFISCAAKIPQGDEVFQNHASYVDSWLEYIKDDPNAIFKAAADANRATDYILAGINPANEANN